MIDHYHVTFKGHRCALVTVPSMGADWLLRIGRKQTEHCFGPAPTKGRTARQKELNRLRKYIRSLIAKTEADRKALVLIPNWPVVKRLLTDSPDRRARGVRWKIVGVHGGKRETK